MFYLLYDPKTTFKSHLEIGWNYALMLPYNYMRNHYGRHYIALPKFVTISGTCRYVTPMINTNVQTN